MNPAWLKGANAQVEENKLEAAAKAARREAETAINEKRIPVAELEGKAIDAVHRAADQVIIVTTCKTFASIAIHPGDEYEEATHLDTAAAVSVTDAMKFGLIPEKLAQRVLEADAAWEQQRTERAGSEALRKAIFNIGAAQAKAIIEGMEK
jgi:hypothetical protein